MIARPWQIIPNDSPIILHSFSPKVILSNQPIILNYSQSLTKKKMNASYIQL